MTRSLCHIFIPVSVSITLLCGALAAIVFSPLAPPGGQTVGYPSIARVEPLVGGAWVATARIFDTSSENVVERLLLFTTDEAAALAAAAAAEPRYIKPLYGDPVVTFWVNWGVTTLIASVTLSTAVCLLIHKLMSAYCTKRGHSFVDGKGDESANT